MRTAQEIFDTVVAHLRKQGCRSEDENGCLYRTPDGLSCAVGALIPSQAYSPAMENKSLQKLLDSELLPLDLQNEFMKHRALLSYLQDLHDVSPVSLWEVELSKTAARFNLGYTAP
jgi:hypothetical protein